MPSYTVHVQNGGEPKPVQKLFQRTFEMDDQASVADLSCELKDFEGLQENDYRLVYRKSDYDEGLEDDELLVDVAKADGDFVAEVKQYNVFDGTIQIACDNDLCGQVDVLMGSTKSFEHFRMTRETNKLKMNLGKII